MAVGSIDKQDIVARPAQQSIRACVSRKPVRASPSLKMIVATATAEGNSKGAGVDEPVAKFRADQGRHAKRLSVGLQSLTADCNECVATAFQLQSG